MQQWKQGGEGTRHAPVLCQLGLQLGQPLVHLVLHWGSIPHAKVGGKKDREGGGTLPWLVT